MKSKNELRKIARDTRKKLDIKSISLKIQDNLMNLPEYKSSENIFCYCSFQDEIQTTQLLEKNNKKWYIPRISGHELLVCEYCGKNLIKNDFGILEPDLSYVKTIDENKRIDMIILPALMSDRQGYRLGYGKGFYDRYIANLSYSPYLVTLLPEALLVDNLPIEKHDCKCHIIVTENSVYRT